MELHSPYLEAIQAIPGTTPGQKFKELNSIARRIARGTGAHGDAGPVINVSEVPEALLPLVRVEIANVLQQSEGIVEALKSEDAIVVDRAMRLNWFFKGENKDIISPDYFETHILPYVCLDTRVKLIKRLAINLRTSEQTKLAADFYTYLARKYGRASAEPFFIACTKDFVYETVMAHRIVLSCRAVKHLFVKYPDLVIGYMKLSKPNEDGLFPNGHKINIRQYTDFLPRLIKKHSNAFIEILEMHDNSLGIKLSNKSTETFLKNNVEVLLNKPSLYTAMMPIKVITAKLTKVQFKSMFEKLYPKKWQDFNYASIKDYLEYYPEQERMSLIIDSYTEVYKANLLDNYDAINIELLCMLPADERAKQARIKLEKEPEWHKNRYDIEKAWRCYLPIDESIPSIKTEITKSSSGDIRSFLLRQMLYTCKVNNDMDMLLGVLRYFTSRHKNEQSYHICTVLESLTAYFDLYTFGKDYWVVLDNFMKFLEVKDQLSANFPVSRSILAGSLYYDLVHDQPIDDKIAMIMKVIIVGWNQSWSILEKFPEYDKRCFDAFLSTIPVKYPQDNKIWKGRRPEIIGGILKSMYDFNASNLKANNKIEKLLAKNYPWLCEVLKKLVLLDPDTMDWQTSNMITLLKDNEPELYNEWVPTDEDAALSMQTFEALARLRDDPQNILDHWEAYLKQAKSSIPWAYGPRFVKVLRWHQNIPIKFAERCLKDVADKTDDCHNSLMVLGILFESSAFARIIEPLVPKYSTIDITDENSKEDYRIMSSIPRAMRLTNPPVPLSLVLSFCDGEYLNLALMTLTNVCRRTSIEKIKPFTKSLVDRRVTVRKHGIRLFCLVASIDDLKIFLTDLWKTETHRSIRSVVYRRIKDLFFGEPTPDTWAIMKECIVDLRIDDNDIVECLVHTVSIPDEYFVDYIKELLEKLANLQKNGFSAPKIVEYTRIVILNINAALMNILPEDFCQELLRKYFCNPSVDQEINEAGTSYVLDYLRPDKPGLESRLSFFCPLYEDVLKKHWDVPHPNKSTVHPINYLSHDFINRLATKWSNNANKTTVLEAILKTYLAVLKPEQDFASYALLTLCVAFKDTVAPKNLAIQIGETFPRIVEALSPELVVELTDVVQRLIENRIDLDHRTNEIYTVIETLCTMDNVHCRILAAKLLFRDEKREFDDRHNKIVDSLRQTKHPAVVSLVYHHMNTLSVVD